MRPTTIPLICGISLAAMIAAGASHWWSVQQLTGVLANTAPGSLDAPAVAEASSTPQPPVAVATPSMAPAATPNNTAAIAAFQNADAAKQSQFYEALIEKLGRLETQNRDLLDQLAETNHDLMKLEFRVDTHSASFRPMPAVEERPYSNLEPNSGVLPPRSASPGLPSYE